jgi:ribosome biogenesis protein
MFFLKVRNKQKIINCNNFRYALPDIPYTIQSSFTASELNNLINTLLREAQDEMYTEVEFDFLVKGEFLKKSLHSHLKERDTSFEEVIDIEYVERFPAPEPLDVLLHDDWVASISTLNDYVLTGCYDNTVNIWNTKGEHKLTLTSHEAPVKSVGWISMSGDVAYFASGSKDQTIMIWEWKISKNKAKCIQICKGHERSVESIAISPDSKQIVSGGWDNFVKIWSASPANDDVKNGTKNGVEEEDARTPILTLEGHREAVTSVQWIDNSTILSASWDHTIKIWDMSMQAMKNEIAGNKSFFDINYSYVNGMIITASADQNLRLYDPRSNRKNKKN